MSYLKNVKIFILLSSLLACTTVSKELLKVEVTATNNYQSTTLEHPKELQASQDPNLTSYVSERIKFQNLSDPDLFIQVMDWVASQWKHDGLNQAPLDMSSLEILKNVHEKGERYRCVEYGKVMADILSSMGHYSRQIGLQSNDVAYGGTGRGHVATEVWSNTLNKWVFFDPQFSIYAVNNGEYLNIYDIYLLKTQGKFEQIDFITTSKYASANNIVPDEAEKNYRSFLKRYLGFHISTRSLHGKKQRVYLMMESKLPALTFQGMGNRRKSIFTKSSDIAYPQLNQVVIALTALPKDDSNFQDLYKKYDMKTEEKYLSNMWRFAAKGEIAMRFNTNMDNFQHYQIKTGDSKWTKIEDNEFVWKLSQGKNMFQVRSVSNSDVYGPPTFMEILYR